MRIIEVEMVMLLEGKILDGEDAWDEGDEQAFITKDGTLITEFDGCDWKENPVKILTKLTKNLKKGDELMELADGSDTLWYGIIRAKPKKIRT